MAATKRQLLERGAKLLGPEELARRLNMPATVLEAWLCGTATMPDGKLMDLARLFHRISQEGGSCGERRGGRIGLSHERDDSGD